MHATLGTGASPLSDALGREGGLLHEELTTFQGVLTEAIAATEAAGAEGIQLTMASVTRLRAPFYPSYLPHVPTLLYLYLVQAVFYNHRV